MKGLPPINYADAAQLVEQLKLLGDEWFEGDYEDGTLVVGWGPATTVAAALLCMAQYAGQLEERMMELVESNTALAGQLTSIVKHPALQVQPWQAQMIQSIIDRPDERVELMKPRQYGRVTGVEWRYRPGETPDRSSDWPWHSSWWKPSDDPIRNLVKAGALIAAEIDRLQRQR